MLVRSLWCFQSLCLLSQLQPVLSHRCVSSFNLKIGIIYCSALIQPASHQEFSQVQSSTANTTHLGRLNFLYLVQYQKEINFKKYFKVRKGKNHIMSRYVSKVFLPMSPGAGLLHTEASLWWQNWMALDSQHLPNIKSSLKDANSSILQPSDTHTLLPEGSCVNLGSRGGLERDWNHDSQQRGHSKPWPQQHQLHDLQAGWCCLHSSGTYREGFVFSDLAKSN